MKIPKKFRYKVELWGKVEKKNELNQTSYMDSKLADVWAEFVPQTGSLQKQQAETMLSRVTHKIYTRYRGDIASNMHFRFRGKRFDIRYILNPYFRNETLEIFVEEVFE